MGQAPTSQARPRDADHLLVRPSNLAAKTLSLVEHTLSKLGGDPCPVRRGLAAAVKCYVRKARFFLCRQRTEITHHYRRYCSRVSVSTMKGKPVLFSVFEYDNCWPQQQRKKRDFCTQHFAAAASPRLTGHGSPPNLESICSTILRVLAAKFEVRRWSVSRGLALDLGA